MTGEHIWHHVSRFKAELAAASPDVPNFSSLNALRVLSRPAQNLLQLAQRLRRWRLRRLEQHYQMCADIEQEQARQAYLNAAWYQKQAALARLAESDC